MRHQSLPLLDDTDRIVGELDPVYQVRSWYTLWRV